jgi:hypothetical protein
VDEAGNNVELFIQSPPGSWVPLAPIPVGNHPVSIAAVDLNSDSLTDLVISNLADSTLTVLMGQGDGTFLVDPSFSTISLPAPAVAVRGGDFKFDVIQNLPEVMGISQTLQSPIILVNVISERADVDGSDQVDGRDLAIWAKGFGLSRGDPGYSSLVDADVNLDGKIDGFDLAYITLQFGKSVPLP